MSTGLADKLYWRPISGGVSYMWHCFRKVRNGGYVSLCGFFKKDRSDGQDVRRPRAEIRCARCDVAEMARRGWAESGPQTTETR